MLGFRVHHPFQGPLTHLCDLEAGYGGVWAPNFGGAAPGFEPRTSCLRVRSVTITLQGLPPTMIIFILKSQTKIFRGPRNSYLCKTVIIIIIVSNCGKRNRKNLFFSVGGQRPARGSLLPRHVLRPQDLGPGHLRGRGQGGVGLADAGGDGGQVLLQGKVLRGRAGIHQVSLFPRKCWTTLCKLFESTQVPHEEHLPCRRGGQEGGVHPIL